MPLGTEVGLGSGDIVLDGDAADLPPKMVRPAPNFWLMSVLKRLMDQDATWYRGRPPQPR